MNVGILLVSPPSNARDPFNAINLGIILPADRRLIDAHMVYIQSRPILSTCQAPRTASSRHDEMCVMLSAHPHLLRRSTTVLQTAHHKFHSSTFSGRGFAEAPVTKAKSYNSFSTRVGKFSTRFLRLSTEGCRYAPSWTLGER